MLQTMNTRTADDSQTLALARAFADNVLATLGQDLVDEVISRNAAGHPDVCATHDFIDSNELMLDAMQFMGLVFDPADDKQAAMTSRAWTLAKSAGFNPHHPSLYVQTAEPPAGGARPD